jgi:integral membrane protein
MSNTTHVVGSRVKNVDRLPSQLAFYRFAAWVTGLLLLALAVEMVAKYGFGREVEMLGPDGFLTLTPTGEVEGINISRATVIAHGWFYVVYLFASFRVWSNIRWPFWRFLWLASGGLFPVFSFVIEHFATRAVRREITAATPVESGS